VAIVVSALTPILSHAQAPVPPRTPDGTRLDTRVVTVPMSTPGDRPIIEATINGIGPIRLGVETGAPFALQIFPEVAEKLELTVADTAQPWRRAAQTVDIGGLHLSGVEVAVPNVSVLATVFDGLIGLAAYHDLLVTIDFPRKQLSFSRDTLPVANGKTILATSREAGGLLGIPVQLGAQTMQLVIDTQGGTSISTGRATVIRAGTIGPIVQTGIAYSPALGGASPEYGARLRGDARIGQYTFPQPIVSIVEFRQQASVHGIVGVHALANFAIALDQRTRRVRFTRTEPRLSRAPSLRGTGIAVVYSDGPMEVRMVMENSVAERAGVRGGDIILEVNGKPAMGYTPAEWDPINRGSGVVELLVDRNGVRQRFKVEPAVLVQ
jgi:membrane-associated protease RseP (regulator of RpoE activity)